VRARAATATMELLCIIVVLGLATMRPLPAVARQAEGSVSVTPPVNPVKPNPSDPWDLAPWTAVALAAVALCALLAWWIVGRDAVPHPAGDDSDAA